MAKAYWRTAASRRLTIQGQLSDISLVADAGSIFVIYNDNASSFSKPNDAPLVQIEDFRLAEAMCYKIGKKGAVTRAFLFGQPATGESRCCYPESADYDALSRTYATLILSRKDNITTSHIAWVKL